MEFNTNQILNVTTKSNANVLDLFNYLELNQVKEYEINTNPIYSNNEYQLSASLTEDISEINSINKKVYDFPKHVVVPEIQQKKYLNKFSALQKWEGTIDEIKGENIIASLKDLTNGGRNEIGEFTIDDINLDDRNLLRIGSIFYWSIGYEEINGTRKRTSYIRFRRLPKITEKQIKEIDQKVQELKSKLIWE